MKFYFVTSDHTQCHIESKFTLEEEGYESDGENFIIPTHLKRTSKIYHVSSD